MKILLSWMGYDSDFLPRTAPNRDIPNTDGPNISMHRYFEDREYDRHVILYTPDARSLERKNVLKDYFSEDNATWPVEFREVTLADADVMSLNTLQMKLTALMLDFKDCFADILVTTGTKTMHTVWHLIHLAYRKRTQLLQIRPKQYTADGKPELIEVKFDESHLPQTAIASERSLSHPIAGLPIIVPALEETYILARKLALADGVPALILGESGTGKEVLAKYILAHSARNQQPFKVINCAALLEDSLQATLFGQAGGSNRRKGIFETCDGGTLFLDEIGHLSHAMQLALLRVLQDGEILPLGATEGKRVDVRVIAATNHNILEDCRTGKFRWDLYYRLAVVELRLPRLLEWTREDREMIWNHLVIKKQQELGKTAPLSLHARVKEHIFQYTFPGNVREMENLIARLYVVSEERVIPHDLPPTLLQFGHPHPMNLEGVVKDHIKKVMSFQGNNVTTAATVLGIARNTLINKCEKYHIPIKSQVNEGS